MHNLNAVGAVWSLQSQEQLQVMDLIKITEVAVPQEVAENTPGKEKESGKIENDVHHKIIIDKNIQACLLLVSELLLYITTI